MWRNFPSNFAAKRILFRLRNTLNKKDTKQQQMMMKMKKKSFFFWIHKTLFYAVVWQRLPTKDCYSIFFILIKMTVRVPLHNFFLLNYSTVSNEMCFFCSFFFQYFWAVVSNRSQIKTFILAVTDYMWFKGGNATFSKQIVIQYTKKEQKIFKTEKSHSINSIFIEKKKSVYACIEYYFQAKLLSVRKKH